jgi:tetratricopeptide (TPR) repeat protein
MSLRSVRLALLLVQLAVAWSAGAADAPGLQLYENGDYEAAVEVFARTLADRKSAPVERELARAYLAASLHALGRVEEAQKQLEILAHEHPEYRMDPVRFPPELVALAEVIHQRVEAEQGFARREAELMRQAQEEALRRPPPPPPVYLRPEAVSLFEAVDRQWTLGAGLAYRRGPWEGSARVLVGNPPAFHLQGGLLLGSAWWKPFLGLRASLLPGLDSYGGGPVLGGRFPLRGGFVALLEVGADYFVASREDRYRFAVTAQAGLGLDIRLP